jgi:hypothetical protein
MEKRPVKPQVNQKVIGAAAMVVAVGVSFYSGVQFQKNHMEQTGSATASQGEQAISNRMGQRSMMSGQRPAMGQVTAISAASISVQDSMQNTTATYAVTSNTKVTNNGGAASASDIKTGDNVLVLLSNTNSSEASQIELNPSMPSQQGGNPFGQ